MVTLTLWSLLNIFTESGLHQLEGAVAPLRARDLNTDVVEDDVSTGEHGDVHLCVERTYVKEAPAHFTAC